MLKSKSALSMRKARVLKMIDFKISREKGLAKILKMSYNLESAIMVLK